jgi:hypothetical protein
MEISKDFLQFDFQHHTQRATLILFLILPHLHKGFTDLELKIVLLVNMQWQHGA